MTKFINYIINEIKEAEKRLDEMIREEKELFKSGENPYDSMELSLENANDNFRNEIFYLYNICIERYLPDEEIEKIFCDYDYLF